MQTSRLFAAAALTAALAGCVAPAPYRMTTQFNDDDFQPWASSGPATLQGQAFLKTVGGDVKTCAGEAVMLIPGTQFDREMIQAERAGHSDAANVPPSWGKYAKHVTCDAQGNFVFDDLVAREWIVETIVQWGIPTGSVLFPVDKQGGVLNQTVSLRPGLNRTVLSAADEVH
jgi:hypothetical protein